jgi:hypothetical protein
VNPPTCAFTFKLGHELRLLVTTKGTVSSMISTSTVDGPAAGESEANLNFLGESRLEAKSSLL